MRIDHVGMYVKDLEGVKNFFVRFFGAKANDMYHNPKTGLKTYFLTFDEGARLEIMTRPEVISGEKALVQAGYVHLSFCVGGKEKVNQLTALLSENGYAVLSGPRMTGDGYYESTVSGPEGNQIEIVE